MGPWPLGPSLETQCNYEDTLTWVERGKVGLFLTTEKPLEQLFYFSLHPDLEGEGSLCVPAGLGVWGHLSLRVMMKAFCGRGLLSTTRGPFMEYDRLEKDGGPHPISRRLSRAKTEASGKRWTSAPRLIYKFRLFPAC